MAKKYDNPDDGEWREDLMCNVFKIEYDFRNKLGLIFFPQYDCPNWPGLIDLFESIDPGVVAIQTFSGRETDQYFWREPDPKTGQLGEWQGYTLGHGPDGERVKLMH